MTLRTWLDTLRPYSFPASIVPVLLAPAVAVSEAHPVSRPILPLFLVAVLAFHAGTNVLNDYYDFIHGVDREGVADAAGVLVHGSVSPRFMRVSGHCYFALAALLSAVIAALRGVELLVVAALGGTAAYLYTGKRFSLKYYAAGDLLVFLLLGPVMTGSAFYALTGIVTANAVVSGIVPGLLVTLILEANSIRDLDTDRDAGIRTLSGLLGRRGAVGLYVGLLAMLYLLVALQWVRGTAPATVAVVLLSLPLAVGSLRGVLTKSTDREVMNGVLRKSAALETVFGSLYILGFVAAAA
ncbi:MAG: prenyltransferase [Spirochaetaceae bacterium]